MHDSLQYIWRWAQRYTRSGTPLTASRALPRRILLSFAPSAAAGWHGERPRIPYARNGAWHIAFSSVGLCRRFLNQNCVRNKTACAKGGMLVPWWLGRFFVTGDSANKLDKLENYDQLDPKINQNRSKNGPTWCQDGVQDGLLGIRAVRWRILDHGATTAPIHEAVLGGLLGSCWGSCWAHVGIFFRDEFLMPFGRRFGPQHGRKSRPKSSPRPSPRRSNFGLGNRCQKWSKISWIPIEK